MKVLIATEKPFAPAAVEEIKKIVVESGNEFALLERYTDSSELSFEVIKPQKKLSILHLN